MEECQKELDKLDTEPVNVGVCEQVMGVVLEPFNRKYAFSPVNMLLGAESAYSIDGKEMCMNIYDIRLSDTSPACGMNWPPDLAEVVPYLGVRSPLSLFVSTT